MTYFSGFYPSETAAGSKGSAAFLGANNSAIVYLYRRSATALTITDMPNGSVSYAFSTGIADTTLVTNGWVRTIPSGTDPLYVVAATAYSSDPTDTILNTEWSSPVVLAQDGTAGLNTATIFLFRRSTSPTLPSVPTATLTYTYATGILSGDLAGWSQTAPDSTLGRYLFVTTATAVSNTSTDTISTSEWATVRILSENGISGYTAYLTNESHTLVASADGTVSSYTGATGSFKVFLDGVGDISSSFTINATPVSNPQGLTFTRTGNTYTITGGFDAGEDVATITLRATGSGLYSTVTIDKTFTLSKSKSGSNAKLLAVSASRQIITYDGTGAVSPATQTNTFIATKQNTTATVTWSVIDGSGNTLTPTTNYLSAATGDSVTMTVAQFASALSVNGTQSVTVVGTLTDVVTLTDRVSVGKVTNGTNGTSPILIDLSNDTVAVPSNNDGSSPVLTGAVTTVSIFEGTTDVSSSWVVTASPSAGVTGTLSTRTYTVTTLTTDTGFVDFTATRSGFPTQTIRFSISKAKAGTNGTPATVYDIRTSSGVIKKNASGTYVPTTVTFSSFSTTGSASPVAYSGRFIVATSTDGVIYTDRYTSAANESSYTYTLIAGISHVRVRLYLAGGTTTLIDEEVIPVAADGTNGTNGTAAISGYISNESLSLFTFADGTVTSFAPANGLFKIYSGETDVTSSATSLTATASGCTGTINTATNTPVNGQPKGYYQVTAMSGDTATLTLSGIYNGVTIIKVFSLSKTKAGYEIVGTLPVANLFEGRTVYLTTDDKLYRYTGTSWTAATAAADISGEIQYQQIGNGAVRVQHLLVTPNNLNPDPQFRDLALWTQDNESGTVGDGPLNGTGAAAGWYVEEITTPPNATVGTRYLALWSGRPGMNNAAKYVLYARPDLGNYFRPQSGAKYELKANCENAANQTASIGIQWLDVSQTYITQETITFNIGEVGQKSLQITAPSNASFGRVIVFNQGGSTFSGYFRIANIVVRDTVGATMVVDGAITTDKLNAGAVTAAKISVTQLSAISATIGTLRTASTGSRTEIKDNLIEIYDSSNVLRVRIGVW